MKRTDSFLTRRAWLAGIAFGCGRLGSSTVAHAQEAKWPSDWEIGPWSVHADYLIAKNSTLGADLSRLNRDVATRLDLEPSKSPVHIYLFDSRQTYRRYVRQYFPEAPDRPALFIKKQRMPGMVFAYRSRQLAVDLRHEATHAVLHGMLPYLPLWLDEGLAEYFEVAPANRIRGGEHLRSITRSVHWHRVPALENLERIDDLGQMDTKQYRDAWAWVHYLLHGPEPIRQCLRLYLSDIAHDAIPIPLSRQVRQQLPAWKAGFRRHFLRLS